MTHHCILPHVRVNWRTLSFSTELALMPGVTLAGIELAHRIRKGQHALPLKREGRKPSLKTMCDCALNRASEPILADSIFCPPISGSGALRENAYLGAVIPNGTALN